MFWCQKKHSADHFGTSFIETGRNHAEFEGYKLCIKDVPRRTDHFGTGFIENGRNPNHAEL